MLKSHAADKGAISQEGQVHGGKCQQRMHHIGGSGADFEETGNTKLAFG
jgi:hypothetical protein